jgi:hypothetical protein
MQRAARLPRFSQRRFEFLNLMQQTADDPFPPLDYLVQPSTFHRIDNAQGQDRQARNGDDS